MIQELITSLRLVVASVLVCCVAYTGVVLGGAAVIAPEGRQGDLAAVNGAVVGSWRVAQAFTRPEYLWPRPSAVNYAADATGGSNFSPANPAITDRANEILARLGATADRPAPADLVTASGSGIDPHVSLAGAVYQAERIAAVRGVAPTDVEAVMRDAAERTFASGPIVNVLRLNVALDQRFGIGVRTGNP